MLSTSDKVALCKEMVTIYDVLDKYGIDVFDHKCKCPFHTDTNASMVIYDKENQVHCYGCGVHYDVWDFVKKINHVNASTTFTIFEKIFGVPLNANLSQEEQEEYEKQLEEKRMQLALQKERVYIPPQPDYLAYMRWYLNLCRGRAQKTDYFQARGLNEDTIKRFRLGYDVRKKLVTIPYNKRYTYFQTRSVVEKRFWKPPASKAGTEPIFNEKVLTINSPVFVVESPICAMSVTQCGGNALALCGAPNFTKIIRYLKNHKESQCKLILCLDNDAAGEVATKKFAEELDKIQHEYLIKNIADECKDPNELLMKDKNRLELNVQNILQGGNL